MKIIFFTENNYCGGLDSFLILLINHWPNPTDDIVVVCNYDHPGLENIVKNVVRPFELKTHRIPLHWQWRSKMENWIFPEIFIKIVSTLLRYPFMLYWFFQVKKLFSQLNADRLAVVNGGYPAGDSCRVAAIMWAFVNKRKPKCVFNFHNLALRIRWWEFLFEHIVDRLLVKSCASFVSVSKACIESLENRPAIKSAGKLVVIYNGVAKPRLIEKNAIKKIRQEFGLESQSPICLMLGTYEVRKGHEFLLNAFAEVLKERPMAKLIICGFGYDNDIKRVEHLVKAKSLQNHVHLESFRDDVAELLEACDVLLVPSQSFESFGLTIAEAMARSTPVVATNVGGIPEVIGQNEGGICCDRDDIEGFAKAIIVFIESKDLRKKAGQEGNNRFKKKFTASRMAKEYAALL